MKRERVDETGEFRHMAGDPNPTYELIQSLRERLTMNHRNLECPAEIRVSLHRYAREGVPTGDFLRAVLENDLMLAVQRADPVNFQLLFAICSFVWSELPVTCWGSHEAVNSHLAKFERGEG